jgi:hypothetical protein
MHNRGVDMTSPDNKSDKSKPNGGFVMGIVMGLAIGAAIGAAMDDMGVGIGMGMGIGIALGIVMKNERRSKDKPDQ